MHATKSTDRLAAHRTKSQVALNLIKIYISHRQMRSPRARNSIAFEIIHQFSLM